MAGYLRSNTYGLCSECLFFRRISSHCGGGGHIDVRIVGKLDDLWLAVYAVRVLCDVQPHGSHGECSRV